MGILSGSILTFDCFIERTKDNWDTKREVPEGELIHYVTEKYNNMAAAKLWTNKYPKDAKIISPTILLSNISTRKSFLSEVNFSPRGRNSLGHIILDTTAESTVYFMMLTNTISSNPDPGMVVPFLLVPLHLKKKGEEKGIDIN